MGTARDFTVGQQLDPGSQFPTTEPSLTFNFTRQEVLDSRLTFTRASSAWRFNAKGIYEAVSAGVPRFDYDYNTLTPRGLMVERFTTNLLTYSNIEATTWTYSGATTLNNEIGLDGTQTAATINATGGGGVRTDPLVSAPVTAGLVYTWSIYVKLGTMPASDYAFAIYDNTNLTFVAADILPTVTLSSSRWTRITYTFTAPAGCTSIRCYAYRYGPTTGGTVHFWGAQLENSNVASSLVPTTGAQASRFADIVSLTGTALSSVYRQSEGSYVISFDHTYNFSGGYEYRRVLHFTDGGGQTNVHQLVMLEASGTTGTISPATWQGSIFQFGESFAITSGNVMSIGYSYASNTYAYAYRNSSNTSFSSSNTGSYTIPTNINALYLGGHAGSGSMSGHIQYFAYYPKRATAAQLLSMV